MKSKIFVILFLVISIFIFVGCTSNSSQLVEENEHRETRENKNSLFLCSMGPGTSQYPVNLAICSVVEKHTDISLTPHVVEFSRATPNIVRDGIADIGILIMYELAYASQGLGDYEGDASPDLRVLQVGNELPMGIFTTKGSGIESFSDLKGKRFVWELIAATPNTHLSKLIMEFHGIDPYNDVVPIKAEHIVPAWELLANDRADAINSTLSIGIVEEVSATIDPVLIPMDKETFEYINENIPNVFNLTETTKVGDIPAGIPTAALRFTTVVDKSFDEELAYLIVKTVLENYDDIKHINLDVAQWNKDRAVDKLPVPYHSGAVRYYKEAGLWSEEMEEHQASFFE